SGGSESIACASGLRCAGAGMSRAGTWRTCVVSSTVMTFCLHLCLGRSPAVDPVVEPQGAGVRRVRPVPRGLDESRECARFQDRVAGHGPLDRASAQRDPPLAVAPLEAVEVSTPGEG